MTKIEKVIAELSSKELSEQFESTLEERSQAAKFLGKLGGKASVKKRFGGKSKQEISEIMRKIRLTKLENKDFANGVEKMVDNMKKTIT